MNKVYFLLLPIITLISFTSFASSDFLKEEWPQTDFTKVSINLEDVISFGPPKDGIPSINKPKFKPVHEINDIPLSEPVISVHLNGEARAYPLRILIWHELVNDIIGETPILVTYDPLVNASLVFNRSVDGVTAEFGVSGRLYKSNMLLYDRDTESWWQQYTGEAVVGERLGRKLQIITSRVESLQIFKERFPDGKVLVPNKIIRNYGVNPYPGYDNFTPFLYKGEYKGDLPAMKYLVVVGDEAWPLALVENKRMIKKGDLLLSWFPYQNSVLDSMVIARGADSGNVVAMREIEKGKYVEVPYVVTFAFVFDAFHPAGVVHKE